MQRLTLCFIFVFLTSGCASSPTKTKSVTLEWDDVPDSELAGYRLYQIDCTVRPKIPVVKDGITENTYVIEDLESGRKYCFHAKAVGTNGLESDSSNEVQFSP